MSLYPHVNKHLLYLSKKEKNQLRQLVRDARQGNEHATKQLTYLVNGDARYLALFEELTKRVPKSERK